MYVYTCNICSAITTVEIMNISITLPNFLMSLCNLTLSIANLVPRNSQLCFLSLWISWHFLEFYINGIIQYVFVLCPGIFYLDNYLEIIYVGVEINSLFLLFTHLPVDGYLACFKFEAITN